MAGITAEYGGGAIVNNTPTMNNEKTLMLFQSTGLNRCL